MKVVDSYTGGKNLQETDGYLSVLLGNCRRFVFENQPQEKKKREIWLVKTEKHLLVLCFEGNGCYFQRHCRRIESDIQFRRLYVKDVKE